MAWIRIEIGEGKHMWGEESKYGDHIIDIPWDIAYRLYMEVQNKFMLTNDHMNTCKDE